MYPDDSAAENGRSPYIVAFKASEVRLLKSSVRMRQILESGYWEESARIVVTALKRVSPDQAQHYFSLLSYHVHQIPEHDSAKLYEDAGCVDDERILDEVMAELTQIIDVSKAEEIGFLYDDAKRKYTFNANRFAKHLNRRCHVTTIKDGRIFLYNFERGVYEELSEVQLGKIIRTLMHEGVRNSWRATAEAETVKALQRESPMVDEMNTSRNFINLENGMLSLDTFELVDHDPKYLSTVQIPIRYDPKANAPNFKRFMREITLEDEEIECNLQEVTGYLLVPETKAEKAIFLHGTGANGKSVYANVTTALIGKDNVSSVPLSDFGQQFGLEGLINKSVNISAENEMGGKMLKTDTFKSIVSGDNITINIKYRPAIMYRPFCRLVFLVNTLPDTTDVTNGFERKTMIIPFQRTFEPAERDVNLLSKLLEELPGILNWAIEGLKRLRANQYQFSPSKAIEQCHQAYFSEQNPVKEFVLEHVEPEEGTRTRQAEFYEKYLQWLNMQGIDDKGTRSRQVFWRHFKTVLESGNVPLLKKKVKGTTYFDGLKIVGLPEFSFPSLSFS